MTAPNMVFILSDEHCRETSGCYGDQRVRTPNIDKLAARGVTFTSAYASSPICVPTRGSIATGRYVHQIGCWDSAQAYHGQVPSWGHRLMADGHEVVSVGKLHYRDTRDDNGFTEEILPMHILNGIGWPKGLLRKDPPPYDEAAGYAGEIGPGESVYTDFDRRVCARACDWLRNRTHMPGEQPWVLFVGFVAPHYPLIAPREFYDLYNDVEIPPPRDYDTELDSLHPAVAAVRKFFKYNDYFDSEKVQIARQCYYGLCSFLDHNIGNILGTLEEAGIADNTRVIYTSDHGDCLGNKGIWAKSVMYEESTGIPLIMAGPGIPENKSVATPVTHVDFYPTIVESCGRSLTAAERELPGRSLFDIMAGADPDRVAFSEYHDGGSITGSYMLRMGKWKYVYHVGYPPQLFDLANDPYENEDLAGREAYGEVCQRCETGLREICDPEAVNRAAFADQERMITQLGGIAKLGQFATFDFTPVPK